MYGMSRLQKCHSRTAGRGIDYALDLNEEDRGADEESRGTPTNMIHRILNHIHAQDGAGAAIIIISHGENLSKSATSDLVRRHFGEINCFLQEEDFGKKGAWIWIWIPLQPID